jgi:putative thioredoxin
MADSPNLVNVDAENFHGVVIDGSRQRLVLVDFWADWCAPCRSLMPILAKLASEYGGKLIVAKVNTEEEQEIAAQFGIRSLPTVQLFKNGQVIDQFMGALPEPQVREFLERHLPRESDALIARAKAMLDSGDAAGARDLLNQAQASEPDNSRLVALQARIMLETGDVREARELLDRAPMEIADDPEVAALRGRLAFIDLVESAPEEGLVAARLRADPDDNEARYRLAAYRVVQGDYAAALEHLLTLMQRDRKYGDDAARKAMLKVFDLLGGEGEMVTSYRAKMLNALY